MGKGGDASGDFMWVKKPEPHIARTERILEKHPEIRNLFGPDNMTLPKVLGVAALQFAVASQTATMSSPVYWGLTYWVSGFANQNLFLANHELSHNLCFNTPVLNRLLGIVANLPFGIPYSSSFSKYHPLHHRHQGSDTVDMDIPSTVECGTVKGPLSKAVWVACQLFWYAVRPIWLFPIPVGFWDCVNALTCIACDYFVYHTFGVWALVYLVAGAFLGGGLHPAAGHFISEHYVFKGSGEQETFSYYGPLNPLLYNVGYHNEHHDFPRIPGSRLAKVKAIAPEFYENLKYHTSWSGVVLQYITEGGMGPYSRVKRKPTGETLDERERVAKGGLTEVMKLKQEWANRPKSAY